MIRLAVIVYSLLATTRVLSQSAGAITPDQSIATLSKVWGLLKYYPPRMAGAKLDWDQALMATLPKAEQSHSRDELCQHLLALVNQLGRVDPCKACLPIDSIDFQQNLDLAWLDDSTTLTLPLRQQLTNIVANRNQRTNQHVQWNLLRNRLEFTEQR